MSNGKEACLTLPFDAILFDLDGVLVDSHLVVERTLRRWAERHSLNVPDLVSRAHGRRSIDTVRDVAPHLDAIAEVAWLAGAELSDLDGVVVLPGAIRTLGALSDQERAVVTSGGGELARLRLRHVGLPIPSVLMAAEDVREGKPSPEGYLEAARRLAVSPSRCIVFEDAPAGVAAGRTAGATVVALSTTFPRQALSAAHAIVSSLDDVQIVRGDAGPRLSLSPSIA